MQQALASSDARASSVSSLCSVISVTRLHPAQVSLNIQKYAHMQNTQRVARGEERLPYHKIPVWWLGMLFNAVGEVGNLVAYGYAEATVVTPIGLFFLNSCFRRVERRCFASLKTSCAHSHAHAHARVYADAHAQMSSSSLSFKENYRCTSACVCVHELTCRCRWVIFCFLLW